MIWTALSFIFAILFFYYHNWFFAFIIVGLLILTYKRNTKSIFIFSSILLFVFCLCRFTYFNISKVEDGIKEYRVIKAYSNYSIIENDNVKYLYYGDDLKVNNVLLINSKIELLRDNNDFYEYLKTQKVNYLLKGTLICKNDKYRFSDRIKNWLLKDKDESNKAILELILFNDKNEKNNNFYELFDTFSITFMLVVSGFHINLLLKLLKKRKILKYPITFFYLYLLNFSVSSYKAFLYYALKKISEKCDLVFNNSDILSLIIISFLFIDPSYCFNKGFIYSFTFSYVIDFLNNTFYKKSIKSMFIKKILIFLVSIPIILLNSYQINTSAFIVSVVMAYPISFLFIFSFIYLFLDKFYLIYKLYIYLLRLLLNFMNDFSINLIFGKPSYTIIILLYLSLFIFVYYHQNKLYKRGYLALFAYFLFCIFQYSIPIISNKESVYFIDVGQGDCSVLKIKNSKKVVLIDTGGSKYKDIANDTIIPFLKSKGINEIDKIIISHDDFDHNGAKDELINNFKVNEVIETSLIDSVTISSSQFVNLNVSEGRDNDSSLVLYGEYGGIKYLFTGDISSKKEIEIVNKYDIDVDVVKISHHGSKDSSCDEFLSEIDAKIALIGVSNNNSYKHPSKMVLDRLKKYGYYIFQTNKDGNVEIYKSLISGKIITRKD